MLTKILSFNNEKHYETSYFNLIKYFIMLSILFISVMIYFNESILISNSPLSNEVSNIDEVDYTIFSDEMICDKVPHVDFYPELKGFEEEAKKRGITCYHRVVTFSSASNEGYVSNIQLPITKP